MSEKKTCSLLAPRFLLAAGMSLGVFFACLYAVIQTAGGNVKAYILAVILSALCFLFTFFLLGRTPCAARPALFGDAAPGGIHFLPALIFAAYMVLVFVMDRNTRNMLAKGAGPTVIPLFLLLIAAVPTLFFLWPYRREKPETQPVWLRYTIAVLVVAGAILCMWRGYKPYNYDPYDYTAYWDNVAALYHGQCFSMDSKSFYGYYALFMLPFFKLVGLNAVTAAVTQALENLIVYIVVIYCAFKLTRSDVLRICSILGAVYYPVIDPSLSPQGAPHRLLFPALMMALGVRATMTRPPPRSIFALGYLTAVLAVLWNVETGLVVLVAWGLLCFLHGWYVGTGRARWLRCTAAVFSVSAGIFIAWQSLSTVNQVLLGCWERMSLRDFLHPMFSPFISYLAVPLEFSVSHWTVATVFLLLCLYIGLRDFVLGRSSPRRILVAYLSAMGLMNALYFFNRPGYPSLRLVLYYPAFLLILILMDRTGTAFRTPARTIREELKAGIFAGHMYGFALLLVLTIAAFPGTVIAQQGYKDTDALDSLSRALEDAGVPADTILYTKYASFIDFTSDKYAYTVMGPVNTTTTAQWHLGEKLLKAEHPLLVDDFFWGGATAPANVVHDNIANWFAGVTRDESLDAFYEPPREITVQVKDLVAGDTQRFFLYMPRS